jgi:hypothetical protein
MVKNPIRAAQNKQGGHMRPAGRQFDMPALDIFTHNIAINIYCNNLIILSHGFLLAKKLLSKHNGRYALHCYVMFF